MYKYIRIIILVFIAFHFMGIPMKANDVLSNDVAVKNGYHEYLYNTERICDSISKKSKKMPLIYVWINENVPHIKRVYNTYSFPDVTENEADRSVNMNGMNPPVDAYGLSYAGRSLILFVDNQFIRITNLKRKYVSKWGHDTELRKQLNAYDFYVDTSVSNNRSRRSTLDRLKYIYITDEKDAWKKYLPISDFEVCNPVTMLIYTKDFADKVLNGSQDDAEAINLLRK